MSAAPSRRLRALGKLRVGTRFRLEATGRVGTVVAKGPMGIRVRYDAEGQLRRPRVSIIAAGTIVTIVRRAPVRVQLQIAPAAADVLAERGDMTPSHASLAHALRRLVREVVAADAAERQPPHHARPRSPG